MKKILAIAIIILISGQCYSQQILFHKDVKDTTMGKVGPNLKNFHHFYIGFGFIGGDNNGAGNDIVLGKSTNFVFGYRYKLKICKHYAIGYDLAFNSYTFALEQKKGKIFPDTILHNKKETFSYYNVGLSPYMRFNYGRRGNSIGKFIDLGAYGDWTYTARTFAKDKVENGNIVKITTSNLKYINSFNYGALVRIGFNRWVIFGSYRLSDIFKTSDTYNFSELPRTTLGLQVGIHK